MDIYSETWYYVIILSIPQKSNALGYCFKIKSNALKIFYYRESL